MTLDPRCWRPECNHYQHSVVRLGLGACSPHVKESRFWNTGNFSLWSPGKFFIVQSGILSIGIQDTTQGIWDAPLTIGLRNPSSTDKDWNPVPGIWNPWHGIQNLRPSWITLQGVSMCTTFALHLSLKGKYFCQSYLKNLKSTTLYQSYIKIKFVLRFLEKTTQQ